MTPDRYYLTTLTPISRSHLTTLTPRRRDTPTAVTDLILHLDGAQLAVDAVLQPLAAVAGAAAVDPGVDEVPAGRHVGVPADPPAGRHLLGARTAVPADRGASEATGAVVQTRRRGHGWHSSSGLVQGQKRWCAALRYSEQMQL